MIHCMQLGSKNGVWRQSAKLPHEPGICIAPYGTLAFNQPPCTIDLMQRIYERKVIKIGDCAIQPTCMHALGSTDKG